MKVNAVHTYFKMSLNSKAYIQSFISFPVLLYGSIVALYIRLSKLRNLILDFPYLNSFADELKGFR